MQYLAGASLERPTHLHHLAAWIDASQKAALLQPVVQSLLAYRHALVTCHGLGNMITDGRLQE